jgi:hypothetical protein
LDDRIVTTISRWLAGHLSDEGLRRELDALDVEKLTPEQAEAVLELHDELEGGTERPDVEMIARETLEVVAVGSSDR